MPLDLNRRLSRRSLLALSASMGLATACGGSSDNAPEVATSAPAATEAAATATRVPPFPTPVPETLRSYADKAGIEVGTNLDHLDATMAVKKREFNTAFIASIDTGWNVMEPRQGVEDYSRPERAVAFALQNNLTLSGGNIIWSQNYPEWIKAGRFSASDVRDHVFKTVAHFKGRVKRWVVLNEFEYLNTTSADVVRRTLGQDVVDLVFRAAREADSEASLWYNDYGNETLASPRYPRTKAIVDRLRAKQLIDGVGLQMHIDGARPPSTEALITGMQSFGIPTYITEMDVNLKDVVGTQDERFNRQAEVYRNILQAALASGVCHGVTFWNIGDRYSWLEDSNSAPPGNFSVDADATMFDDDFKPKPAYYAVLDVLKQQATR